MKRGGLLVLLILMGVSLVFGVTIFDANDLYNDHTDLIPPVLTCGPNPCGGVEIDAGFNADPVTGLKLCNLKCCDNFDSYTTKTYSSCQDNCHMYWDSVLGVWATKCACPISACGVCHAGEGSKPRIDTLTCSDCSAGGGECCAIKNCAIDYPGKCGSAMDDGCSGTIDCSANCGALLCINGVCVDPDLSYWEYMNGSSPSVLNVDLNDYVRIVSFKDPPYKIFNGTDLTKVVVPVFNERVWKASVSNMNSGYNFSANSDSLFSNNTLMVSSVDSDDLMNFTILSPHCGSYYNLSDGEPANFTFNTSDSDDFVVGKVIINGVEVESFDNSRSNIVSFNYPISVVGMYNVEILANSSRGNTFRGLTNFMVYDTDNLTNQYYVSACIDSPKNFDSFSSNRIYFNASSTLGIKVINGVFDKISPARLLFDWTFVLSDGTVKAGECVGLGSYHCVGDTTGNLIKFYRNFPTVNDNFAYLSVEIPANEIT